MQYADHLQQYFMMHVVVKVAIFLIIKTGYCSRLVGNATSSRQRDNSNEFMLDFFLNEYRDSGTEGRRSNAVKVPSNRYATFKPVGTLRPKVTVSSYIDIINDRKHYDEVKQSRTNDVNSVWSPTFLAFFGLETFLIGSFIIFGILMFAILQCKPKSYEKHVTLFE